METSFFGGGFFGGEVFQSVPVASGGMQPLGGSAEFWLRRIEDEEKEVEAPKKAVQTITRVAKKQAEKQEFKLAPLKVAFQRANYKYRPDYADIYRRA